MQASHASIDGLTQVETGNGEPTCPVAIARAAMERFPEVTK